jgi:hypothetical protein
MRRWKHGLDFGATSGWSWTFAEPLKGFVIFRRKINRGEYLEPE